VHPARLAFFLDIVKTAIDDRVERIELGRGPAVGCPATASRRPATTALTLPLALTATPLAAAILSPGAVPPVAPAPVIRPPAARPRVAGPSFAYPLIAAARAF
jgi:hypothetical protein